MEGEDEDQPALLFFQPRGPLSCISQTRRREGSNKPRLGRVLVNGLGSSCLNGQTPCREAPCLWALSVCDKCLGPGRHAWGREKVFLQKVRGQCISGPGAAPKLSTAGSCHVVPKALGSILLPQHHSSLGPSGTFQCPQTKLATDPPGDVHGLLPPCRWQREPNPSHKGSQDGNPKTHLCI